MATAEVCHGHWLSPATFYKLKARYGGMDVSDAKHLRSQAQCRKSSSGERVPSDVNIRSPDTASQQRRFQPALALFPVRHHLS